MEAITVGKTIAYGKNRFKVDADGNWSVLLFGTSGPGQNPHYYYSHVKKEKIPAEVLKKA
jgi:hypothetical protein